MKIDRVANAKVTCSAHTSSSGIREDGGIDRDLFEELLAVQTIAWGKRFTIYAIAAYNHEYMSTTINPQ